MAEEKKEPNPWAICHAQVGPKKTPKFERCVQAVKKSLKEGKNPLSLFLENEIIKIRIRQYKQIKSKIKRLNNKKTKLKYIIKIVSIKK